MKKQITILILCGLFVSINQPVFADNETKKYRIGLEYKQLIQINMYHGNDFYGRFINKYPRSYFGTFEILPKRSYKIIFRIGSITDLKYCEFVGCDEDLHSISNGTGCIISGEKMLNLHKKINLFYECGIGLFYMITHNYDSLLEGFVESTDTNTIPVGLIATGIELYKKQNISFRINAEYLIFMGNKGSGFNANSKYLNIGLLFNVLVV